MIDTTMKSPAVTSHVPAKKIETREDWKEAKRLATEVQQWWNKSNGELQGGFNKGYAIHHVQVCPDGQEPYNFFVVSEEMLKSDKKQNLGQTNYTFPAQVIYNPEIVTALPTHIVPVNDEKRRARKVAKNNITEYHEGCMSYGHRKEKKVERFVVVKVRYQIVGRFGFVKTREEWIDGLKSHIFQHECDHAKGIDIHFGDGERKFNDMPVMEWYREEGKTMEQVEAESEESEKELIEAVKNKNEYAIIESETDGTPYRLRLDEELPEGYVEGSLETYYEEDGTLKTEFADVPVIESSKVYGNETPAKEEK